MLPDDALNLIGERCGRFDPGAGLRAQMQKNLAGVHRRKEVTAEEWNERQARAAEDQESRRKHAPALQAEPEQIRVPLPQPVETVLEAVMNAGEHTAPLLRLRVLAPLHFG